MRVRIAATEDDVRQGRPDCFTCPLARRINRFLKPGFCAAVYPTAVEIYESKWAVRSFEAFRLASKARRVCTIDLPKPAVQFVRRFDGAVQIEDRRRTKPPAPFTLVISSKYATKTERKTVKSKPKPKPWWET